MKPGLVSVKDLDKRDIERVLELAERYSKSRVSLPSTWDKVLGTLFFEPSTRTRLSFVSAMLRLGGKTLGFGSVEASSIMKGENFQDTVMTFSHYCDLMVMRHPAEGSARLASELSDIPVINGGDGPNQHPTQALCDLFTIRREKGRLDLKVALAGDLLYGRTAHSLASALALFGAQLLLISPPSLKFPPHLREEISGMGIKVEESGDLKKAAECDVLYMTRIQKERMSEEEYGAVGDTFVVKREDYEDNDVIIMHPLPRVAEIERAVDALPNAKYFDQVRYSVPVRMALIDRVLDGKLTVREGGMWMGKCANGRCITNAENLDTKELDGRCFYCEKPF